MYKLKNTCLFFSLIFIFSACKKSTNTNQPSPPPPFVPKELNYQLLHGWWKATQTYYPSYGFFVAGKIYFGADKFFFHDFGVDVNPSATGDWEPVLKDSIRVNWTGGFGAPAKTTLTILKLTSDSFVYKFSYDIPIIYLKLDSAAITSSPVSTVVGTGVLGHSGDGGPATSAKIRGGQICIDANNNIYFYDEGRIRKVSAVSGIITTIGGTGIPFGNIGDGGPAINATINEGDITVDGNGNIYISDIDRNVIRKISASDGIITRIAGIPGYNDFSGDGGQALNANLGYPFDLVTDLNGNLYFADRAKRVRKISAATGIITTVAGNGTYGYSGDGGPATQAGLGISGIAVDAAGNIFIADEEKNRIRKVSASTGIITTIAGNGNAGYNGEGVPALSAMFKELTEIEVDDLGNIYTAEYTPSRIRKISVADGKVYTIAGTGNYGYTGEGPHATAFAMNYPHSISTDSHRNVYFSDRNYRIRKVNAD